MMPMEKTSACGRSGEAEQELVILRAQLEQMATRVEEGTAALESSKVGRDIPASNTALLRRNAMSWRGL